MQKLWQSVLNLHVNTNTLLEQNIKQILFIKRETIKHIGIIFQFYLDFETFWNVFRKVYYVNNVGCLAILGDSGSNIVV
jgi:hypothetical protein